jgi:hypothetical protein
MQTNRSGWVVVAFFLVGGIALWVTAPDIWIGQILVAVAVFVGILYLFISRRTRIPDALKATAMLNPTVPANANAWGTAAGATAPGALATDTTVANVKVSSSSTVVSGNDAGAAVLEALKQYGIDPSKGGTFDLSNIPAAREAVLKALSQHGVDVAHQIAAMVPGIPIQQSGEPVEAMTKLKQLNDAGLISSEEFEQNKKRILEGL